MHQDFLETLLDISRQLAENRTLDTLLDYAMEAALDLFGAEYGYLILLNDDGSLDFRVKRSINGRELEEPERQISQTILNQVIQDRQDIIVADATSDAAFQDADSVVSLQIRSVICVPLTSRGNILGALYLENRSETGLFTQEDLHSLKLFACQAAVAIENAALNDELERRVAARTAELEARNEELNAFAHIVAHDLKTPLTAIIGYAEILEEDITFLPQQEMQKVIQSIVRSGRKMSSIINELFLLASMRKKEVPDKPLDTAWIVRDVLQRLEHMIEQNQAEITCPDNWPVALGYAPWVEEVWVNYISNALKYGGQPPRLELGATVQEDGMIRFWVRDNGRGLSPEEQDNLFTPFMRLENIRTEGQGLGLPIVQRIVDKLGGQVGVESQVGEGSVFSFTLPAAAD